MFVLCILLVLVITSRSTDVFSEQPRGQPLSDEYIDYINNVQSLWQAGRNFESDAPIEYLRQLGGVIDTEGPSILPVKQFDEDMLKDLPDSFDAREHWPMCPSLSEIRDESSCFSSWAMAAVEVMTDRLCIATQGKQQFHFSAMDAISCCSDCTTYSFCTSGDVENVWAYWIDTGIVSGGNFDSKDKGCMPYIYPKCSMTGSNNLPHCNNTVYVERCEKQCVSSGLDYDKEKHFGEEVYRIESDERKIRAEILNYGPVQSSFKIYEDFYLYKSGVYRSEFIKITNLKRAVKILGWGEENNTKYWLVANSQNEFWGENGFFKIVRGENHCGIETKVIAGKPNLNK